jgi:hypothetical protein
MAGPRTSPWGALLLIPLAALTGCAPVLPPAARAKVEKKAAEKTAEKPAPPDPTPAPSAEALPPPSPSPPPTPETAPQPSKPPGTPSATDVVDPGGDSGTVSLVQAAKAERERRSHAGEPVVVITDKSLPHLPKGQLTVASPAKKKTPAAKPDSLGEAHDEQYWRGRALDIRQRWKKAADEAKELEQSAAGWRRRFYAENDPYARDSQIKPEWDRVLDRLGKARGEVDAAKKELDDFLEEGRRGGALPGWLREGAEQEPAAEKKSKEPGTLEPKEPSIYKQPPESPPGDRSETVR